MPHRQGRSGADAALSKVAAVKDAKVEKKRQMQVELDCGRRMLAKRKEDFAGNNRASTMTLQSPGGVLTKATQQGLLGSKLMQNQRSVATLTSSSNLR